MLLTVLALCRGEEALPGGVRDLDFSPGHQQQVLAVACEDGSCTLWQWEKAQRLAPLECPTGGGTDQGFSAISLELLPKQQPELQSMGGAC